MQRLINEAMYDPMHGVRRLPAGPNTDKITRVINNPDSPEEDLKQVHALADALSDYKDPRPGMPDDSFKGVKAQQEDFLKNAQQIIEQYLPGFSRMNLDYQGDIIDLMFLRKEPFTLALIVHPDTISMLEDEFGYIGPAQDEADKYRENPYDYDPGHFMIDSVLDENQMEYIVSPYWANSCRSTYRDAAGYYASTFFDQNFIKMSQELRPDHKVYVLGEFHNYDPNR